MEGDANYGLGSAATLQNEALTRFHFRDSGLHCLVQEERTAKSWEVTVTRARVYLLSGGCPGSRPSSWGAGQQRISLILCEDFTF